MGWPLLLMNSMISKIHLQLSWEDCSVETSSGVCRNSNKNLISTQSPVKLLGSRDAVVHPQIAIFLTATVGVMVAAIFMTTAAQISLTYVHQVSQINVQHIDASHGPVYDTGPWPIKSYSQPCLVTMSLIVHASYKLSWAGYFYSNLRKRKGTIST